MYDSIFAHDFFKQLVCKIVSLITDDCPWGSNLLKIFLLINPTIVLASFLGQDIASTHLDT